MKARTPRPAGSGAPRLLRPLLWIVGLAAAVLLILRLVFNISLGFFFQTRLSLRPTALTLTDIRSMEFLITAEYFGEVIGTARDYFVRRAVPDTETLLLRLMNESRPKEADLSPVETTLLNSVRATLIKRNGVSTRLAERLAEVSNVLELVKPEFQANHFNGDFAEALVEVLLEKRDIAYLARGRVTAGYDLSKLDEGKYLYCRETGAVYLQAEPEILAKEINPWFIYDPKNALSVKGFEIISQSGIDLEEEDSLDFINAVKEECRRRLQEDALRTGLRERARSSAEETIDNLFRIFNPAVKSVKVLGREEFEKMRAACPDGGGRRN